MPAATPILEIDGPSAPVGVGLPAMGVLVPEFPSQTHVFFWREITAWREAGASVDLLSTRRPPEEACRHAFAETARRQTHYVYPPSLGAVGRRLLLSPRCAGMALGYIHSLDESGLRKKLKVLALLGCAADLVSYCRDRNVRHVHCHSFADAAHICAMAYLLGGPTYSLTLHGDLPVYGTDHRRKLEHCTAVGCDGPHLAGQLVDLGYPRERILPNWMGVDTDVFTPPERPADAPAGRLRLITVARLNRNKGHRFALQAMRRLVEAGCDVTYTLVGEGPFRGEIRDESRRLGLTDRVRLAGTMGEEDVLEALREHDVFCLPSVGLGEAGPISVMEAMACGLPVVASVIGATPSMIHNGETGFLCPQENVDALAQALRTLCDNPAKRLSMGAAARRSAVEHFDSRQTSLRLFDHIRRWTPQTFST